MTAKPRKVHFALDRKAIAVFVFGACLVGVLLFADGLLVGMGLYRQSVWPVLVAGRKAQAAAVLAANHAPRPPAPAAKAKAAPAAPAAAPAPLATAATAPANACGLSLAPAAQAAGEPEYDLQLGSFADAANAARLAASLKTHGCTAQVMQFTDASHRVWNVVRIGPFASLQDAAQAAAQLRRSDGLLALVRPVATI